MFHIEKSEMYEHMHTIKKDVEEERMKSEARRAMKETKPPYWIILLTFLHLRK